MAENEHRNEGRRDSKPLLDPIDAVIAGGLLAVVGYLYYVTTTFDEASFLLGDNVLPTHFPRLTLFIIALLTLVVPFEHRLWPQRWRRIKEDRSSEIPPITWLTMAFLVLVVFAEPYLGTVITILLVGFGMPMLWGERRWHLLVPYAIGFAAAVTIVFNQLLRVYFEPGIFNVSF